MSLRVTPRTARSTRQPSFLSYYNAAKKLASLISYLLLSTAPKFLSYDFLINGHPLYAICAAVLQKEQEPVGACGHSGLVVRVNFHFHTTTRSDQTGNTKELGNSSAALAWRLGVFFVFLFVWGGQRLSKHSSVAP